MANGQSIGSATPLIGACWGLAFALSCDPTAGLADSADAVLPEQKTYFDVPGTRTHDGPWTSVAVDISYSQLVAARRADDSSPTLHLFGVGEPEGCRVSPNIETWFLPQPSQVSSPVLPFLESVDESGTGTLRFTTAQCEVLDLAIQNAGQPEPHGAAESYLVPTQGGYTLADPWHDSSVVVAEQVTAELAWGEVRLLWADGQLASFSQEWEPLDTFGTAVVAAFALSLQRFVVEDAGGLHHVTLDSQSGRLASYPILPGSCGLQRRSYVPQLEDRYWLIAHAPCEDTHPAVVELDYDGNELERRRLPFELDARQARVMVDGFADLSAPFIRVAYLTDTDEAGWGSLWLWWGDEESPAVAIGHDANLDHLWLDRGVRGGGAWVNHRVRGGRDTYDMIRFAEDGTATPLAESVLDEVTGIGLIINFDGTAGDLATQDALGGMNIELEDVPPSFLMASHDGRRMVLMDRYDGTSGQLLLWDQSSPGWSFPPVADGVVPESVKFSWFMPAVLFIRDPDPETLEGTLMAYNYELDSLTSIAQRVKSFDLMSYPMDGVVYAVPSGPEQGLWFARAK